MQCNSKLKPQKPDSRSAWKTSMIFLLDTSGDDRSGVIPPFISSLLEQMRLESFSSQGFNCSPVNKRKNEKMSTSAFVGTPFTSIWNPLLFLLSLFSNYFSLYNHQLLHSFQSLPHQSSLFISLSTLDLNSLIHLTFFISLLAPLVFLLTVLFHISMPSVHLYCVSCGYEYILPWCLLPPLFEPFSEFLWP